MTYRQIALWLRLRLRLQRLLLGLIKAPTTSTVIAIWARGHGIVIHRI